MIGWELTEHRGEGKPTKEFLLTYQRAILMALEREGFLSETLTMECMNILKKGDSKVDTHDR